MSQFLFIAALVLAGLVNASSFAQLASEESATDINRVKVGQFAPDFTLEDSDGKAITLANFRGKKTVVVVFYRGHW